jgi:hypothetical protein
MRRRYRAIVSAASDLVENREARMTAFVLVSGVIFKRPEMRTSAKGNQFASASIKEASEGSFRFWTVRAFNDAGLALMRLDVGDAVAVTGALSASTYEKGGEARVGLAVLADQVTPLKPRKREKPDRQVERPAPAPTDASEPRALDRHAGDGADVFGDDVPF